jgi:nucleoside-diphosphate-sugar epimerase
LTAAIKWRCNGNFKGIRFLFAIGFRYLKTPRVENPKILIIGAGGQLGSELTQALWSRYGQSNVIATDVKDPGGILAKGNFEILDVLNQKQLSEFISKHRITQIYHLAAVLSATGEKNPRFAWHLNMDGLIHVLDAAVEHKLEKIYWPSSIAVFGPNTPKNSTPQDTVMDPTTIYGISKLAGERWCNWYFERYGLDVRSLRYPGLIGYKAKPGGGTTDYAVDIFFRAIKDKEYVSFLKEDTFLPMMYMDDAINATLELMDAPAEKVKVRSSYNISAMSFCPQEIASEIRQHIPGFKISYAPDFRQGIADSWPRSIDDSRARQEWGWSHRFGLKEMVAEILTKLPAHLEESKVYG